MMSLVPLVTANSKAPQAPFGYLSLEQGLSSITATLMGVPGVYMLVNTLNPTRYYIGSSVNLGRRLTEYRNLTTGTRTPVSRSEQEIAGNSANN